MITAPGSAASALIWSDGKRAWPRFTHPMTAPGRTGDSGGLDGTTPTAGYRRHLGLVSRPRGRGAGRAGLGSRRPGRWRPGAGVLGRRSHPVPARRPRLPGHRQRRLHQRPHGRAPRLRRHGEQVPARQPRRAHRPGHAVPDQFQPGLRAQVRQYGGRARHDRQLGHGQRPRGRLHVRPADLPRRPERTERPQPASARGLAEQPGGRPGEQPAAPGLLTRTAGHRRRRELAERDAVPGQQAGDHAEDPDQGRLGVHREGQLYGPARAAQRRRRHHRGLVPGQRRRLCHHRAGGHRGLDAAQRLPDRQADLRLLRHGQRLARPGWRTACWSR